MDYYERTGDQIPYRKFGYSNLNELLSNLPGVTNGIFLPDVIPILITDIGLSINNDYINFRFLPHNIFVGL